MFGEDSPEEPEEKDEEEEEELEDVWYSADLARAA